MAEFMEGTVDVPGAGKIKKRYVYIPAGIAAAYVAYRWYQASRGEGPPPGADGMYTSDDQSEMGLSTSGGSLTVGGNSGSTVTDGTRPGAIDDNAEWTQRAAEVLGNAGYDTAVIYAALGEFLARRSLDKAEATIARAAIAAAGQPPIGGPYSVIEAATTAPAALTAPKNVKATATSTTSVTLSWDPVTGAGYYRAYRSGSSTNVGATDAANRTMVIGGLQPNTEYSFQVAADTTTGKPGPKSAAVKAKTKALTLGKAATPKASQVKARSFRATTTAVKGATVYEWYVAGKPKGKTERPYRDFTDAAPNTVYRIQVRADTVGGSPGPLSGTLSVKTLKK